MSLSLDAQEELFEKRLNKRLTLLPRIPEADTITQGEFNAHRQKIIQEEMRRLKKKGGEREKGLLGLSVLPDDLAQDPFIKDLLKQKDLRRRYRVAIELDAGPWEDGVGDTFITKRKASLVSHILLVVGEMLIMYDNPDDGK